jgi:hypothetical protein
MKYPKLWPEGIKLTNHWRPTDYQIRMGQEIRPERFAVELIGVMRDGTIRADCVDPGTIPMFELYIKHVGYLITDGETVWKSRFRSFRGFPPILMTPDDATTIPSKGFVQNEISKTLA